MEIKIEKSPVATTIKLDGSLDTVNSTAFLKSIEEVLTQDTLNIVVDTENLTYISSSGLRAFLILKKGVQSKNGKMSICKLRPEVLKIFEMTGYTKIMTIE